MSTLSMEVALPVVLQASMGLGKPGLFMLLLHELEESYLFEL